MPGPSTLDTLHAACTLAALLAGYYALAYDGVIRSQSWLGRIYLWATLSGGITGAGLLTLDGRGAVHGLGIGALLLVVLATWSDTRTRRHQGWRYVAALGYTLALFLQMVRGLTQAFTRDPGAVSLALGWSTPDLQATLAAVSLVFLAVVVLQVRCLWRQAAPGFPPHAPQERVPRCSRAGFGAQAAPLISPWTRRSAPPSQPDGEQHG